MDIVRFQNLSELIKKDYANMAGIVISQDEEVLYEQYFNDCTKDTPIHVFSVTKSIISILIGMAIDKGFIESVDQKVLDFFPDYTLKRGEKTIQTVSIKTILTMTAPYKYRSAPYTKYFSSEDWVKTSLDLLGGKKPIGTFRYAPLIGPDVLSGILLHATGKTPLELAKEWLFTPLGITTGKSIQFESLEDQLAFYKEPGRSGWVADPKGTNTAGWGLSLTSRDLVKIGELMMNKGKWKEAQLVSEKWIKESLSPQSKWEEMDLEYGYLWWVQIGNGFAAMGDGGNTLYVNPEKKLIVAITSLFKPVVKDRIDFIMAEIEPHV